LLKLLRFAALPKEMLKQKTLPHTKCGSGKLLFADRWQEASGVRDRRRTRRIKRRLREGAGGPQASAVWTVQSGFQFFAAFGVR